MKTLKVALVQIVRMPDAKAFIEYYKKLKKSA